MTKVYTSPYIHTEFIYICMYAINVYMVKYTVIVNKTKYNIKENMIEDMIFVDMLL